MGPAPDLPKALLELVTRGWLARSQGSWQLRSARDGFGNPLETELSRLYSLAEIAERSAALPAEFVEDGVYGSSSSDLAGPGAIPDVVDFADVVAFACSADGAPFCLDFRSGTPPSIIWWDDVYWRRVAPTLESFLSLFDLSGSGLPPDFLAVT